MVCLRIVLIVTFCCSTAYSSYCQLESDGAFDYCNSNNKGTGTEVPTLSNFDVSLISHLQQVQIFTRHGARNTNPALYELFGEPLVSEYDLKFDCDVMQLETRTVNSKINNDSYITFGKKFLENKQIVEGNCLQGQSLYPLLTQHKQNGQTLFNGYINNNNSKLNIYNTSMFYDIYKNVMENNFDSRFIIHSTNYERTLGSAIALVTSMINELINAVDNADVINGTNLIWNIMTHDKQRDPYVPEDNYIFGETLTQFMYSQLKDSLYYQYWESDYVTNTSQFYSNLTNVTFYDFLGIDSLPAYCDNLKIPLSFNNYNKIINISYDLIQYLFRNEYNMYVKDKEEKFINYTNSTKNNILKLISSPMRHLIHEYIINNTNNIDISEKNIVYHSFHDSTIFELLGGMGISDGIQPIFAEMLSLEIYVINIDKISKNISQLFPSGFAFRLLRNNKILRFSNCSELIELYNSELCDLNVLLNILSDDAMPMVEWEIVMQEYLNNFYANYSVDDQGDTNSGKDKSCSQDFIRGIIFGILIGIATSIFALIVFICVRKRNQSTKNNAYSSM